MSRRQLYLAAAGGAALIAAVLVAVSLLGGSGARKSTGPVVGLKATAQLLARIPQNGMTLGNPNAPYRLVEYGDIQCPYCGIWARDVFPGVVKQYVRAGTIQVVFRGMDFVGADSVVALKTITAAGEQNRLWNVLDLLYRNQGTENTGWVTDSLVNTILAGVSGLDSSRVLADRDGSGVATAMSNVARLAALDGVTQTPTFYFGAVGDTLQPLNLSSIDASSFAQALRAAMAG